MSDTIDLSRDSRTATGNGLGYHYQLSYTAERQRKALNNTLMDLRAYRIINNDDADQVENLLIDADRCEAYALGINNERTNSINTAADKLTGYDPDAIVKAAKTVVSADAAQVATKLADNLIRQASEVAFKNIGKLPELVNEQFDTLAARVPELARELNGCDTPQAAIDLGLTAAWAEMGELQAAYVSLRTTIATLRHYAVIPAPKRHDDDFAWHFRNRSEVVHHAANPTVAQVRAQFIADLEARPYLPASRDEVLAVRKANDD